MKKLALTLTVLLLSVITYAQSYVYSFTNGTACKIQVRILYYEPGVGCQNSATCYASDFYVNPYSSVVVPYNPSCCTAPSSTCGVFFQYRYLGTGTELCENDWSSPIDGVVPNTGCFPVYVHPQCTNCSFTIPYVEYIEAGSGSMDLYLHGGN